MFKFLHTADIHLDSPLRGLESHDDAPVDEIRGATRRAFDNLIDLAIEEEVDFLLIAGDLYDGDWKDYNTGLFFVGRMGRLAKAGIRVFTVSGNHDAASQIAKAMPLPDNVSLFHHKKPTSIILEDLGVIIHGQSYTSRAVSDNLASKYPQGDPNYFNIGMLHTSLNGREGHEDYAPCTIDDLISKGYDYWALGHVHKREVLSTDPWLVFPGNIQGRHVRETGSKGATLVTVDDGRVIEVEFRELDVLRWAVCKVDLSGCEAANNIYDTVRTAFEDELDKAAGNPLALRLQLVGISPFHGQLHADSVQWIEKFHAIAVGLGSVWLEKVKINTSRKTSLSEMLGTDTPLNELLQAVENLDLGKETLTALIPDLANLKTRLPAELLDVDFILERSSQELNPLRQEVKELLIARLVHQGGEA